MLKLQNKYANSGLWLMGWLALAGWASRSLAIAWPYELLPPLIPLVLALPGIIFRGFDLVYLWQVDRPLQRKWRVVARIVAIPLGVLLAFSLFSALQNTSMARFENELDPFVKQVETYVAAPCPPVAQYVVSPTLSEYFDQSNAIAHGNIYYNSKHFVIEFPGRSIDIDGSTIYYDSSRGIWQKFHNDNSMQTNTFNTLTQGMAACRFTLR